MAVLSSFSVMGRLYERGSDEGGSSDIGTLFYSFLFIFFFFLLLRIMNLL